MIFIYELGYCHISNGETLADAIKSANKIGFDIKEEDLSVYQGDENLHMDGDLVYSDKIISGYQHG